MSARDEPWLAIVNPAAGRGSGKHWRAIEWALRDAGVEFETVSTRAPGHGEELVRAGLQQGRRRIIGAGGDGSVNEIVHGVMTTGLADTREVTLAVAPLGTGNDWARSLGIGRDPQGIARAIARGRRMLHDVGAIDFSTHKSSRRWFINVAGAGYDAYVTERVPRPVPSALTYLRSALTGLATYRSPYFSITADQAHVEGRLLLAFVANARYCGNRMLVAPGALMDDGLLDLVSIRDLSVTQVLRKLPILYNGKILADPVVAHRRAAALSIDAEPSVTVQADGQIVGRTPASFTVVQQALGVIVR